MNKKLNFIFEVKKIYKVFLHLLIFFVVIFFIYLFTPKFFNFTPKLIQESLNKNNNINIKNISNIDYNFFPSPRLRLSESSLEFGENILKVENAEIDIILNPVNIINYKILDYKKIVIKGGLTNIEINKIDKLIKYIKKNEKKISFKKNNIILLKEKKKLLEINDSLIKINTKNNIHQLNLNGSFFKHKVSFLLESSSDNKTKIIFKIPELDIATNILLKNKDNLQMYDALVDIEILNNLFQFHLIKKKNIKINKGFVRSNLTNSLFTGTLSFEPYFSFNLVVEPSTLNFKKLIPIIQQKFFLQNSSKTEMVKKIDGFIKFKNMFEGNIVFNNGEIIFKNFKVGKNIQISFDAKVSEFGKKGKIQFNLSTSIHNENTSTKDIKILGYIIPSTSKVIFEKIIFDNDIFSVEKTKNYEKKFKSEVIDNSLTNIFDDLRVNKFFKNF